MATLMFYGPAPDESHNEDAATEPPQSPSDNTNVPVRAFQEGAEHWKSASDVILRIRDDKGNILEFPTNGIGLGWPNTKIGNWFFGRIIALAGDFFADYDRPICMGDNPDGMQRRAQKNIQLLENDEYGYLIKVDRIIGNEAYELGKWHKDGLPEAQKYMEVSKSFERRYIDATPYPISSGITDDCYYARIAWNNMDHFGKDARLAYTATHNYALDIAQQARVTADYQENQDKLLQAYRADAFACHYLTDLFSSGHLRTPRRLLHQGLIDAGLNQKFNNPVYDQQAHIMHDEDCAVGVMSDNEEGFTWIVYGDKHFLTNENAMNKWMTTQAVQASVDEIWDVYTGPNREKYRNQDQLRALKWTPNLDSFENQYSRNNPAPLWNPQGLLRRYVPDRSNFELVTWVDKAYANPSVGDKVIQLDPAMQTKRLYRKTIPILLRQGGFIQTQAFPSRHNNYYQLVMNCWGPITTPDGQSMGIHARIDVSRKQAQETPGGRPALDLTTSMAKSRKMVHWMRYKPDSDRWNKTWTGDVRYIQFHVDANEHLSRSWGTLERTYEQSTSGAGDTIEVQHLKPPSRYIPEMYIGYGSRTLSSLNTATKQSWQYLRFFIGYFSCTRNAAHNQPELMIWRLDRNGDQWVTSHTLHPDIFDEANYTANNDEAPIGAPAGECFVKQTYIDPGERDPDNNNFEIEQERSQIMQVQSVNDLTGETGHYLVKTISPDSSVGEFWKLRWQLTEHVYPYSSDGYRDQDNWQILVSKMSDGSRVTLGILLEGKWPKIGISTFDEKGILTPTALPHPRGTNKGPQIDDARFVRPYFAAINQPDQYLPYTVLFVSLIERDGKFFLHFRTINLALEYTDSEVLDDLGELNGHKEYTSLKWLRVVVNCTTQGVAKWTNAILHVYSLHGVLGARVFAERSLQHDGTDWELVGEYPYLGQASSGAGLGSYGLWDPGLLPYGMAVEFKDINYWTPIRGWGMGSPDDGMPDDLITGWESTNKPSNLHLN